MAVIVVLWSVVSVLNHRDCGLTVLSLNRDNGYVRQNRVKDHKVMWFFRMVQCLSLTPNVFVGSYKLCA